MNRRRFMTGTLVTLGLGAGSLVLLQKRQHESLSFANLLEDLQAMQRDLPRFSGEWNAFQNFNHMAQSVEMSMLGFPVHRSNLFKQTVGSAAYSLFTQQGKMTHNLAEPIPGAPTLARQGDSKAAFTRLLTAMQTFANYQQPLKPHFTFGELSHAEYAVAHALHIQNHFEQAVWS